MKKEYDEKWASSKSFLIEIKNVNIIKSKFVFINYID